MAEAPSSRRLGLHLPSPTKGIGLLCLWPPTAMPPSRTDPCCVCAGLDARAFQIAIVVPPHPTSAGRKLHDDVPPMAASRVSQVLSRELDVPADELFSSFNLTHPVGSASISQVCLGMSDVM